MELNLLFLPLLGGYIFYIRFNGTAYWAKRASGHNLLFGAAAFGLAFLVVARVVVLVSPSIGTRADYWTTEIMRVIPGLTFAILLALVSISVIEVSSKTRAISGGKYILGVAIALLSILATYPVIRHESLQNWLMPSVIASIASLALCVLLQRITRIPIAAIGFRVGVFALGTALAISVFANYVATIEEWWKQFSPYSESGTAFFACVLGSLAWMPLNLLYPYTVAVDRLHASNRTNALDKLLHEAARDSELLQLTLSDGKFYIGTLDWTPPNAQASGSYVRLLPMASGYRDERTKQLTFTTYYDRVYAELRKEGTFSEEDLKRFLKVLPIASIVSANAFDPELYIRFDRSERTGIEPVPMTDALNAKAGQSETNSPDDKPA